MRCRIRRCLEATGRRDFKMRRFAVTLFALPVAMTATPADADLEACIPVLEAAETHSNAIRPAQVAHDLAEANARATLDKAKGDAAIAMNNIKRHAMAAGQEWYGSEAEAEAQATYNLVAARADVAYDRAMAAPRARLARAQNIARREFLASLREAWDGPTSGAAKLAAVLAGESPAGVVLSLTP